MNLFIRKMIRYAVTLVMVLVAIIIVLKIWAYYTESPWTRDAKFSADVVAIAPDVTGLITRVAVHDNQFVKKGDLLFQVDHDRFQKTLDGAQADVDYYQALVAEKKREADRRNRLGAVALSRESIDQSNNLLQTTIHQLSKATAARDLARLDLTRSEVRAPADGWVTNLNVYGGEFINRGVVAVALVKADSFYVMAYMEETKIRHLQVGYRAEIRPLGDDQILHGTVESVAAGITDNSRSRDSKGMATVTSNLEWVRLAQRVPVRIRLDKQFDHRFAAGTTATVIITGKSDRKNRQPSPLSRLLNRLREFG